SNCILIGRLNRWLLFSKDFNPQFFHFNCLQKVKKVCRRDDYSHTQRYTNLSPHFYCCSCYFIWRKVPCPMPYSNKNYVLATNCCMYRPTHTKSFSIS